jgi:hypothetical protein
MSACGGKTGGGGGGDCPGATTPAARAAFQASYSSRVLKVGTIRVEDTASLGCTGLGECLVTADQPGNRNFNPAPSVKRRG